MAMMRLLKYICDQLCKNPPCSCANFDLFLQFQNAITFTYVIWGSIVEISLSVQKFPSFILVQTNQKSIALSEHYSCFCEDA